MHCAYPADQLSNPTLILKYLQKYDPSFTLTSKMDTVVGFDVLSRELTNGRDFIEVYEYQSPRAAGAQLKNLNGKPELYPQISGQLYRYKNVLINDKSGNENVKKLLEQLANEPNI